jgi:oxygen-independent coproporphyrinogen-3 oxidase
MVPEAQAASSVYLHVPFCRHKCGYCDFTLVAGRDDLIDRYLACLEREIEQCSHPLRSGLSELETLFFGGGTPTHPPIRQLRRLLEIARRHFPLTDKAEISIEANPLDLTDEKRDLLADYGVNRISLGVQSFDAAALQLLERDHDPDDIRAVFQRLRKRFENISLDLIFGVPGQSLASWRDSVRCAVALQPTHISTYGLTWEPGTAFFTRRKRGELHEADEELERDQYALAMDELTAAGFEHYELSNFARPGFRCRHNLVYWRGDEYLAYGPGAARYVHGRRETNVRSVLGWLERIERGDSPVADAEELDPGHRARELIYLGLRMIDGLELKEFARRTSWSLPDFAHEAFRNTAAKGWIELTETHLRLSPAGRFVADRVAAEFL